jgi:signal transduction histidine kinase
MRLPPDIEITCFRIAQEAMTNIIRHAQPQHVWVELECRARQLELVIRDDGVGFDVRSALDRAERGESLGLLSMRERAELVGGQVQIQSLSQRGTEIHVCLPFTP